MTLYGSLCEIRSADRIIVIVITCFAEIFAQFNMPIGVSFRSSFPAGLAGCALTP